jgi:nickel-type superoxide dismutase maturation protease
MFSFAIYSVSGASMLPKLKPGSHVFVCSLLPIRIGTIVVVDEPLTSKKIIKRVKKIREKNGRQEYYLLGDNPDMSTDSRKFGWINKKRIRGKVIFLVSW